jgi:hypothetical protein
MLLTGNINFKKEWEMGYFDNFDRIHWQWVIFDNFDNGPLNKYKNLKNEKNIVYVIFYFQIDVHSNFMQFHYHLIVHQRSLNWNRCKLHKNLMVFDSLSNDNELHEI